MKKNKARNLITLLHLYAATLLAPFFILVAITGGLYVAGIKAETEKSLLKFDTPIAIDSKSTTLDADIRKLLADNQINLEFEYLKNRQDSITTRPTSRDHIELKNKDGVWSATLHKPNLHYSLMELHKGHGPTLFKKYQIAAAIALFLIMISGLVIGFLSHAYRIKTIVSTATGTIIFIILALLS